MGQQVRKCFTLNPDYSLKGAVKEELHAAQAGGEQTQCEVHGPGGRREAKPNLVNKHFVFIDLWEKQFILSIYEAKN